MIINSYVPNINNEELIYDILHNDKAKKHKEILALIHLDIFKRYAEYKSCFNDKNLEKISNSPLKNFFLKPPLLGLYERNFKGVEQKKDEIKSNFKICPYCGISSIEQIDHYLPKKNFPEFSIYSLNLIPICGKCNLKKSEKFLDTRNNREFLNIYMDDFLKSSIFECNIKEPYINIDITIDIKKELQSNNVIQNHFKTLELKQKYESLLQDEYKRIENNISNMIKLSLKLLKKYKLSIKDNILEIYNSITENLNNSLITGIILKVHWQKSLYEALINNKNWYDYIFNKIAQEFKLENYLNYQLKNEYLKIEIISKNIIKSQLKVLQENKVNISSYEFELIESIKNNLQELLNVENILNSFHIKSMYQYLVKKESWQKYIIKKSVKEFKKKQHNE